MFTFRLQKTLITKLVNQLNQLKKGDEKTLRLFYEENKKGFLLFARKFSIEKADALDIYQDAIVAFIENLRKGKIDELRSSPSTYLFAIGKYLIFQRQKQNKTEAFYEDFSSFDLVWEEMPEELATENELKKAFQKLGEQCRKVLQLFYYEEKKLDEITALLDYDSKDVVKSQKSRCLKQLKSLMKND